MRSGSTTTRLFRKLDLIQRIGRGGLIDLAPEKDVNQAWFLRIPSALMQHSSSITTPEFRLQHPLCL